jgi:hypothetical protein
MKYIFIIIALIIVMNVITPAKRICKVDYGVIPDDWESCYEIVLPDGHWYPHAYTFKYIDNVNNGLYKNKND